MTDAPAAPSSIAASLRSVQVGLRRDLEVARHVFRGEVTYTVRDPISFETHAFAAEDYAVLVTLTGERPLSACFTELVRDGLAKEEQEEAFYRFVLSLHRSGLLALPIADDRTLCQRFELRARRRAAGRWLVFLSWRIPLWNPDAFLQRTAGFGRLMYSRAALFAWAVLLAAAAVALAGRSHDLGRELPTLLAAEQALSLWIVLVLLKVVHEFGHAYACRRLGGAVPEMGVTLVLLTPCAYVDASSSWSFSRLRDRLSVCLGGMYFESWVAAGAALVWAFTETSVVHSVAYQAMILASVTTLAFNVNPLMRFDGYFILSDLLQVPNLRDQSRAIVVRWAKRFAIGIDPGGPPWSVAMGLTLAIYAIASAVYRVVVVVGMCAVIAVKFFAVGMALALAYAATTLVGAVFKATRYLLTDDETRPVRIRAAVVAAALLIVPALAVSLPFPRTLPTTAVAARERERIVTAGASGFVDSIAARGVATIRAGEPLVRLASLELEEAASTAEAGLAAATAAFEVASAGTPAERAVAGHEQGVAEVRAATARDAAERLVVRAPIDGAVVELLGATDRGRFIPAGTPVATIAQGAWMAEALLDQIDLAALRRSEQVELRGLSDPSLVLTGRIASIAPAGKREIEVSQRSLTVSGGGDIPVSPLDGHAADVRFLVRIAIDDDARAGLVRGERLAVRLPARPASLVQGWYRGVLRFRERLAAAE